MANNADLDAIVLPRYREAFEATIAGARFLQYNENFAGASHDEWSDFLHKIMPIARPTLEKLIIRGCPGLANFDLDVVLGECPNLVQIIIEGVKVRGDIACLEKCPRLTWVYLMNTDCHGDVAVFHQFPAVTHLNLAGTK